MTTVTPTHRMVSHERLFARMPPRIRIARAVAFGIMTIPLTMLFSTCADSVFDQICCLFQIGVIFALFHAGVVPRRDRIAILEIAALAMMVVLDLRLLSVGPDPAMSGSTGLYAPLLVFAALSSGATAGLLIGHRIAGVGARAYAEA